MRAVDLRELPTFWVTVDTYTDRHEHMEKMFRDLGIKRTKAIMGKKAKPGGNYTVEVAHTHIEALTQVDPPFLVMEDDAAPTKWWKPTIEIPEPALQTLDAIYIGISLFGKDADGVSRPGAYSAIKYQDDYLRVLNMLGMHATLYLSTAWRDRVVEILHQFMTKPHGGCDDPIAYEMATWMILACQKPYYYQADGHSENVTNVLLKPNLTVTC